MAGSRAEQLRVIGRQYFENKRWDEAVAIYGRYIEILLEERQIMHLACGYSNRAECLLRLRMYADALDDTNRALSWEPLHLKSLVRKAKALEGLRLYHEALEVYRELLERSDLHNDYKRPIQTLLQNAVMKDRQTRLGEFDVFANYCANSHQYPDGLEQFVGPVVLRRIPGMNRGLFATRDVTPGEILFVSSPLTFIKHPKGARGDFRIMSCLVRNLDRMMKHARENLKDFTQVQLLVQLDVLAGPYPAGPVWRDTPPMKYFIPVNALPEDVRKLSDVEIENPTFPTSFNSFTLVDLVCRRQYTHYGPDNSDSTGIYCLPTLINHSCAPNLTVTSGGSVDMPISKVFRAAQHIKNGDQLFCSYHNVFCPLQERRALCRSMICLCERCVLEEQLLKETPALEKLEIMCSELWKQKASIVTQHRESRADLEIRKQCIEAIESLEALLESEPKLQGLTGEKKDWIRAGFIWFHRLILDPALTLLPNSTEVDHLRQLRVIVEGVRVMRTIDFASDIAMAMASEAWKQTTTWLKFAKPSLPASVRIDDLLLKLCVQGMEIGRVLYGAHLEQHTLVELFCAASMKLKTQYS